MFTEQLENTYQAPPILSWLTALICSGLILLLIISSDSFATAAHFAIIHKRLKEVIYTNNRPELILDDLYIKSSPEKHLSKVKKAVNIYNAIRYDLFERAQIVLNETGFEINPNLSQLQELLAKMVSTRQEIMSTTKSTTLNEEEIKMKEKALALAKDLVSNESIPKISPLSEMAYKMIEDKI